MENHIIAQITFGRVPANANAAWHEEVDESVVLWFSSMQRSGQILGEPMHGCEEDVCKAYVRLPAPDSMREEYCSRYTREHIKSLSSLFGQKPDVRLLTHGNRDQTCADWQSSPWLVLFGTSVDGLGPVRTSDFSCIPNYLLPLDADEAERLTFWARNRECHERIWFSSGSLEIEAYRALADPLSELNLRAASLALNLEKAVKKPVFTRLFRHYALSDGAEDNRLCPLCSEAWRVPDKEFPYRCDPCRLLCEIGPSGAENGLEWIGTWEARAKMARPIERWPDDARKLTALLRRGHGEGYRKLLHESPSRAWALLEDCLRHDPRLDRQVERRAWFYGSLILETQMPLHRVWKLLREADEEEWLMLEVVGWLAGKNVTGAVEALAREVLLRKNWQDVLCHVEAAEGNEHAKCICLALEERFPEPHQLATVLPTVWDANRRLLEPLEAHTSSLVRDTLSALSNQDQNFQKQRQLRKEQFSSKPLRELIITCDTMEHAFEVGRSSAAKVTPEDGPWLLGQLSHDHPARTVASLIALKLVMSDPLVEPILAFFIEGLAHDMTLAVRIRCSDALLSAPSQKLLPIGREWIQNSSPELKFFARKILSRHAEVQDIHLLRQLLAEGLKDESEHLYLICDCLEALSRFPDEGIMDEVMQAYYQMQYSYGRMCAAKAMQALCPTSFREEHARNCLFDCEEDTRDLAKMCIKAEY